MLSRLGGLIEGAGGVILAVWAFGSVPVVLLIAVKAAGPLGGILGLVFLPNTTTVAPWYAAFAWGNWLPVIFVYGGGLVGWAVALAGNRIAGD